MGPRFKKTKRKRHFLNGGGGIPKWSVRHLGLSIFCPVKRRKRRREEDERKHKDRKNSGWNIAFTFFFFGGKKCSLQVQKGTVL